MSWNQAVLRFWFKFRPYRIAVYVYCANKGVHPSGFSLEKDKEWFQLLCSTVSTSRKHPLHAQAVGPVKWGDSGTVAEKEQSSGLQSQSPMYAGKALSSTTAEELQWLSCHGLTLPTRHSDCCDTRKKTIGSDRKYCWKYINSEYPCSAAPASPFHWIWQLFHVALHCGFDTGGGTKNQG